VKRQFLSCESPGMNGDQFARPSSNDPLGITDVAGGEVSAEALGTNTTKGKVRRRRKGYFMDFLLTVRDSVFLELKSRS
jgi:hypothetical protein